jgi:hypothetical protein
VLGHGHELHHVVAIGLDAGQNMVGKLAPSAHTAFFESHAHVRFVDKRLLHVVAHAELLVGPGEGLLRAPHLGGEVFGVLVLHHAAHGGGQPVAVPVGPSDVQLVARAVNEVWEGRFAQKYFPEAVGAAGKRGVVPVPLVEVAHDGHGLGGRGPLTKPIAAAARIVVQAEQLVAGGVAGQGAAFGFYVGEPGLKAVEAALDNIGVGSQPGVLLHQGQRRCGSSSGFHAFNELGHKGTRGRHLCGRTPGWPDS